MVLQNSLLNSTTERSTFAFILGQTNVWYQSQGKTQTFIAKDDTKNKLTSPQNADVSSADSDSTDEGIPSFDNCQRLQSMFKVAENKAKLFELDSRVGLNGSQSHWSFPCMLDEEEHRFYVYLGDISIDKFTKTTFLNLVNFAEKAGCTNVILVQDRDHRQKDQFQKLFKVLDAHRVSKRGMESLMNADKLNEYIENYAVYRIDIL